MVVGLSSKFEWAAKEGGIRKGKFSFSPACDANRRALNAQINYYSDYSYVFQIIKIGNWPLRTNCMQAK